MCPHCIVFPSCRPEEDCDELFAKTLEKVTAAQLFDYLINNKGTGKIESGHIIGKIYCIIGINHRTTSFLMQSTLARSHMVYFCRMSSQDIVSLGEMFSKS